MKIFLAGGTGVIGTRALPALVAAGHEVTAVARTDDKAALVTRLGGRPARVDLFEPAAVKDAASGHDAVINLATSIPPMTKAARKSSWAMNERLRKEASAILVDAALDAGAGHYVQESICFTYADAGDEWVTEESPTEYPDLYVGAQVAEAQAARFATGGGAGVALRFAQFYSTDSAHVATFDKLLNRRINPFIGKPDSYASFIHAEDAGAAVVAALEVPSGIYNVGDDEPLTRVDAGEAAASALGLKPPRRVPGTSMVPGSAKMLMRSVRVSNAKFRAASAWSPRYRSIREGWGR